MYNYSPLMEEMMLGHHRSGNGNGRHGMESGIQCTTCGGPRFTKEPEIEKRPLTDWIASMIVYGLLVTGTWACVMLIARAGWCLWKH